MRVIPEIYVDGDGCPFKEEIYKVAKRYDLTVFMVCNSAQRIPKASWIKPIVVGGEFDAVDDWIFEHIQKNDMVITNDILLSSRGVHIFLCQSGPPCWTSSPEQKKRFY